MTEIVKGAPGARQPHKQAKVIPLPVVPGLYLGDDLCYRDGRAGEPPGVYQVLKRGERRIFGAAVQVLRIVRGGGRARYFLEVTLADGTVIPIEADNKEILEGDCWNNLVGRVFPLPTTPGELAAMCKALRGLTMQGDVKQTDFVPCFGWQEINGLRAWVVSNGARINGQSLLDDDAPALVNLPYIRNSPYILPVEEMAASVAPLRELDAFWPQGQSYCYYILLGAVAQVMKPLDSPLAGTLNFMLEIIGLTGDLKTTVVNWVQRQMVGAGFDHETKTFLTNNGKVKDTIAAEARLTTPMRFLPHLAPDRDAKPGTQKYDEQMQTRKDAAMGIGNRDDYGKITDRLTNTAKPRGEMAGLRIQAGEGNPRIWSAANDGMDADARCVTVFLPDTTHEQKEARKAHSKRITKLFLDALGAWSLLWIDYLDREQADLTARNQEYISEACEAFNNAVKEIGGEVHSRVDEKNAQVIAGFREYIRFLSLSGVEGAAKLAAEWQALLPAIIKDRAQAEIEMVRQHTENGISSPQSQAQQVLTGLRLLLAQNHITDEKGDMPKDVPERYLTMIGYPMRDVDGRKRGARGNSLFWCKGEMLYSYYSANDLAAMLQKHLPFPVNGQRLRELLEECGAAIVGNQKDGHKGVKKSGPDGKYTQRLALHREMLIDIEPDPDPDPPGDQGEGRAGDQQQGATDPKEPEAPTVPPADPPPMAPTVQPEPERAPWRDWPRLFPGAHKDAQYTMDAARKHYQAGCPATALGIYPGDTARYSGRELFQRLALALSPESDQTTRLYAVERLRMLADGVTVTDYHEIRRTLEKRVQIRQARPAAPSEG